VIADRPYKRVEEVSAPLAIGLGGPLIRSGTVWKVVSLRDLWTLIGAQITPAQLKRFGTSFQNVLGFKNPRFDVPAKELWFEDKNQFGEEPSRALRHGLYEAMIALSVYQHTTVMILHAAKHADRAVASLLGNADKKLWWSLWRDFTQLAEASPTSFLEAVEAATEGDHRPIMSLFRGDEGFMTPTEYLSELLWRLKVIDRLARSCPA
jgi:hypothetical protein